MDFVFRSTFRLSVLCTLVNALYTIRIRLLQMFVASLYVFISYYLTGNYYELFRFNYFLLMCMMVTICAQSWGFFIGVVMPVKV